MPAPRRRLVRAPLDRARHAHERDEARHGGAHARRSRPRRSSSTASRCSPPARTSAACASTARSSTASTTCARSATPTRSAPTREEAERVVLVGGSYIACEVAATLTSLGPPLHDGDARGRAARRRTSGATAGDFFADLLRAHGRRARLRRRARAPRGRATACSASSPPRAARSPADMVVMGTGAMPDVMLARAAGLELGETRRRRLRAPTSRPPRAASGPRATCASTTPCCTARRVRIEHFEVAAAQGEAVGGRDARRAPSLPPRCRTSGPTSPTGHGRVGRAERGRPSTRSCAARSATASSASCTSPAAGSSARSRSAAATTSPTRGG